MTGLRAVSEPTPTPLELGAALAELEKLDPEATRVVRRWLASVDAQDPVTRMFDAAVAPYHWRAVAAYERDVAAREAEVKAVLERAKAYQERTDVLRKQVVPMLGKALLPVLAAVLAQLLWTLGLVPAGWTLPGAWQTLHWWRLRGW